MGVIHFATDLESLTLNAIAKAHDCVDIVYDLSRIQTTIQYGTERDAGTLDLELRQKYPAICAMLQTANSMPTLPLQRTSVARNESVNKANLRQDYYGILCDTAIKKGIKKNFEECIDRIVKDGGFTL